MTPLPRHRRLTDRYRAAIAGGTLLAPGPLFSDSPPFDSHGRLNCGVPTLRKSTPCRSYRAKPSAPRQRKPRDRAPKGRALGVGIPRHARRRNAGLLRHMGRPLAATMPRA